jgi:hypothetical protein
MEKLGATLNVAKDKIYLVGIGALADYVQNLRCPVSTPA